MVFYWKQLLSPLFLSIKLAYFIHNVFLSLLESKPTKKYRSFIVHSDPQRVEDCFEMALTYMSEPKSAGFAKMKKYFADYYPDVGVEK